MRIAYLVNQYPMVSHTFIRREISALEAEGVYVERITIRRTPRESLVDPADRAEQGRTSALLDAGLGGLAAATLRLAALRPVAMLRTLRLAVRCGRRSARGILVHLVYLLEACQLLRMVERSGCHHIHAHFGTNSALVAMLASELGGPDFSFTAHGTEAFENPQSVSLGEKVARAAFTVAVCEYGRRELQKVSEPRHWPRIHVVRCGLELGSTEGGQPSPPADVPRLVCIGRLSPEKGQIVLVDAAIRLARRGLEFELVLVGDGPLREQLEGKVREAGITSKVRFAGWADAQQVCEAIQGCRALVLPSLGEGLPVVIMEAMSQGRPVIASDVGGVRELVESGVTGWLVPPSNPEQLAEAIQSAVQSPVGILESMGQEGQRRILERHDVRKNAGGLAVLFRSLSSHAEAVHTCAASPAPSATLTR
jgi:colanic acid/amylovoran biosynthesis glycosyltransferase